MGAGSNGPAVIIKRKKVIAGGGHHGGAWKVAYADFVTAMMAFFMLMWLLNATTEKQRKGIADYFSPTIAVNRMSGGGDGSLGGESVFSENTLPRLGTGASSWHPSVEQAARGVDAKAPADQAEAFQEVEQALMGRGGDALLEDNDLRHVQTRLTDEGLIIEFFDQPGRSLFTPNDQPTALLRGLMAAVTSAAEMTSNAMAIEAHVRSMPVVFSDRPLWQKSQHRADTVRDLLFEAGLPSTRVTRTTAHADRELISPDPLAARNNRIEVVFLR